jgi:hypothetical protein
VQLEIVSPGETVYLIGNDSEALRVLKRQRAFAGGHAEAGRVIWWLWTRTECSSLQPQSSWQWS